MLLSFEQKLQILKTSVTDRRSDLDALSTHRSSVIETDIQNARNSNLNAMAKLFSLVQYIQGVDDKLLGRSLIGIWKSVETIMKEEHPKIQQLMDNVEPSLAGADEVAGLALQHAMDLALRVSIFYDTKVLKLEQQLIKTSDELQSIIRENKTAIAKARTSQEFLANRVELEQGEKQRLGLRASEVEYDGMNALKECKMNAGLAFYAVGLSFICPPVAFLGTVIGVATGAQTAIKGIKALSKFSEVAVLKDKKADVERKLRDLQHQVDGLMEKTIELEQDRCKCRKMETLFKRLESKAVNIRHTTQQLEFSLVDAKAATTYRLVKIRSARTQVNALQYVDTRERIVQILDHIAREIRGGFVSEQSNKSWFARFFEKSHDGLLCSSWLGKMSRPKRIDELEEHRKLADGLEKIRACTPKVLKVQDWIAETSEQGGVDVRHETHASTFEFILSLRSARMLGLAENFWVRFMTICGGLLLLGWIKPVAVVVPANILMMSVKILAGALLVLIEQATKFLVAVVLVSVDLLVKFLVLISIVGELTFVFLVSVGEIMAAMLYVVGISSVDIVLWAVSEVVKRMVELVIFMLVGTIQGSTAATAWLLLSAVIVAIYFL